MIGNRILVANRSIYSMLKLIFSNKNFNLSENQNLLSVILTKISVMSDKYDRFRSLDTYIYILCVCVYFEINNIGFLFFS